MLGLYKECLEKTQEYFFRSANTNKTQMTS